MTDREKWFFKTRFFVIALLSVGPFALPLLWFNPRCSLRNKILVSVAAVIFTYGLGILLERMIRPVYDDLKRLLAALS